mmetsp:Transcript_21111/g.50956  ORF Transcript_21111/g.50956 Transcript_21111/m.50956 type:complete len:130 (+) Transcript_21111:348-737(+)
MGSSTNDRVKKHREKKKGTTKGKEEMKAKNREYAARCRAKKEIKRLTEEKATFQNISASELLDIDRKVLTYKLNLCDWEKISEISTNEDEKRNLDLKVLRFEVKLLRKTSQQDLMDTVGVLLNMKNTYS